MYRMIDAVAMALVSCLGEKIGNTAVDNTGFTVLWPVAEAVILRPWNCMFDPTVGLWT